MHIKFAAVVAVFVSAALAGCATAPLEESAQSVRVISQGDARACKFLDTVGANNMNTLSKNPEQDARNRAMNHVAQLGGNALVIKDTNFQGSHSGLGGIFHLTADAYRCP